MYFQYFFGTRKSDKTSSAFLSSLSRAASRRGFSCGASSGRNFLKLSKFFFGISSGRFWAMLWASSAASWPRPSPLAGVMGNPSRSSPSGLPRSVSSATYTLLVECTESLVLTFWDLPSSSNHFLRAASTSSRGTIGGGGSGGGGTGGSSAFSPNDT